MSKQPRIKCTNRILVGIAVVEHDDDGICWCTQSWSALVMPQVCFNGREIHHMLIAAATTGLVVAGQDFPSLKKFQHGPS